jgi:hypothetical protein
MSFAMTDFLTAITAGIHRFLIVGAAGQYQSLFV